MIGVALLILFVFDFVNQPDKTLTAFGVIGARFPESFRAAGLPWLAVGALVALVPFFLALLEADDPDAPAFAKRDYATWVVTVRDLWSGNLLFGACVLEAALLGFIAFDLLGERVPAFRRFAAAGEMTRVGGRVGWLVVPALLLLPFAVMAARDALRWLDRRRARGGFGTHPAAGTFAALGSCCAVRGSVSATIRPRRAARRNKPSMRCAGCASREPPGMIGASSATAPYSVGRSVTTLGSTEQGTPAGDASRRWLVLGLKPCGLNSRYGCARALTQRSHPRRASERNPARVESLAAGRAQREPFWIAPARRATSPDARLDANLGDQPDARLDVTDPTPARCARSFPAPLRIVIYYRVVACISGAWETVHVDGFSGASTAIIRRSRGAIRSRSGPSVIRRRSTRVRARAELHVG
jgi:hypothetical protein